MLLCLPVLRRVRPRGGGLISRHRGLLSRHSNRHQGVIDSAGRPFIIFIFYLSLILPNLHKTYTGILFLVVF
ncbi:hypothetical protein KTE28_25235 [Burkholderia multivorans]|uniref:hypothetical protein n=1 Tax=Burkholderia multivorans TaxID=87883 RepID=UPI001C268295|nr:hypothetical protein [Burkholderia multivorans]MBU9377641.1 hypothetical protein [Burkholderia multivorans]